MKLSVDRLKSIDWKQFGVNHGEKIALGFVGLMVVMILFMGTRWKTFQEKQPDELVSQVEKEQQALTAATWPEIEQESLQQAVRCPHGVRQHVLRGPGRQL